MTADIQHIAGFVALRLAAQTGGAGLKETQP